MRFQIIFFEPIFITCTFDENFESMTLFTLSANPNEKKNLKAITFFSILIPIILYIFYVTIAKKYILELPFLKSDIAKALTSKVIIWSILLLTFLYSSIVEKKQFLYWPENKYKWQTYLKVLSISILLLAILGISSSLALNLLGLVSKTQEKLPSLNNKYPLMIFVSSITAGIVEELIFRGFMLSRMYQVSQNKVAAVITSSLIFAAAHYSYGTIIMLVQPFLFGLIFSVLYFKYRNIKMLILIHIIWNILIQYIY